MSISSKYTILACCLELTSGICFTNCMRYPLLFLRFWYLSAPKGIIGYFSSLNRSFFQLFSTPLLIRTFFKPWKNEYREGLVGFSIAMGVVIKFFVILASLVIFAVLLFVEVGVFLLFLLWPILTVYLLFL